MIESLVCQALQVPEIEGQSQAIRLRDALRSSDCALLAAMGFLRRMVRGDWGSQVHDLARMCLRRANKDWLEATVALRELLERPLPANQPTLQFLHQMMQQADQANRAVFATAQSLGLAPVSPTEEYCSSVRLTPRPWPGRSCISCRPTVLFI